MPSDDCLKHILSIVCNVFDAHTCALFLKRNDGQYCLSEHFSLSDNIATDTVISSGMGVAGWIIRNTEPLLINNYDQTRSVLGYYRKKGEEGMIKAFMGCPLDDSMGVLCLDSKRTYSFSTKDQKILSQFAQLITSIHSRTCLMAQDQKSGICIPLCRFSLIYAKNFLSGRYF